MRYRYMDSLRAALMLGGIVFHASIPYTERTDWIVSDPSGLRLFDWIGRFIHTFRMPAFFFVAGFFSAFYFARHEANGGIVRRLTTFVVPLLSTMVLLQPLQYLMALHSRGQPPASVEAFLGSFISTGSEIGHLWFLLFLMAYYVLAWLLLGLRGSVAPRRGDPIERLVQATVRSEALKSKTVLAMACVCFSAALNFVWRLDSLVPGFSASTLVFYMPFFVVGYAAHRHPPLLQQTMRVNLVDWAVLVMLWSMDASLDANAPHAARTLLTMALNYQAAWVIGMGVVWIFSRFADVQSRALRSISDAAYTVYLFHHIMVVGLAYALTGVVIPGGHAAKFMIVAIATFAATLALHHVAIKRSALLRFLFNGRLPDATASARKPLPARAPAAPEEVPSRL